MWRTWTIASRPLTGSVLIAAAAVAFLPAVAHAHAAFQDAVPEPGSRLETSPTRIALVFTEPLNHRLTRVTLVDPRSGRRVPTVARFEAGSRLVVRPDQVLPTGPYRVEWHTVSRLDGHALEGSFGFGVRAPPAGAASLEQSPLARDGWLRIALRSLLYLSLLFFGGGVLVSGLLSPRAPGRWLHPRTSGATAVAEQAWARTRAAGWVAVGAAVAVALAETNDAAGGVGPDALRAYLLQTASGVTRVLTVVLLTAAVLVLGRALRAAAVLVIAALLAIALGGHANSASPRALAVGTDWLHLVAGTLWIGGIAQIGAAWLPRIKRLSGDQRRRVIRSVLQPFGRIALPAAVVVAAAGVGNAVIELGRPSELWNSSYGLALATKMTAVALVGLASYLHAMRLRPRLLRAGPTALGGASERRHWRLLGLEPPLGAVVVSVAALLAVFPLPPRQLLERAEAGAEGAPSPRAPRAPSRDELAVAGHAGPWIAAVWAKQKGDGVSGTIQLYDPNLRRPRAKIRVTDAAARTCGPGCATFRTSSGRARLRIFAVSRHRTFAGEVPFRWSTSGNAEAERLARAATATMRALSSARVFERLSGGVGRPVVSQYRLQAPDRYTSTVHSNEVVRTVVIGGRSWTKIDPGGWEQESLGYRFDERGFFPWVGHLRSARLLTPTGGRRESLVEVALADPGGPDASRPPFWFRLSIDRATKRVVRMRMTAPGHFMVQRYFAFNRASGIRRPR